jgi:hypothetical protein
VSCELRVALIQNFILKTQNDHAHLPLLAAGAGRTAGLFRSLVGTLLGVVVVVVLSFQVSDPACAACSGAVAQPACGCWRAPRGLEKKARRAAVASVGVAKTGCTWWMTKRMRQIGRGRDSEVGVTADAFREWPAAVSRGRREMQDGMEMIAPFLQGAVTGEEQDGFGPDNFIPLDRE